MDCNGVYIADSCLILPPIYDATYMVDHFYPKDAAGEKINRMAQKLAKSINIKNRTSILDLSVIPQHTLQAQIHTPFNWGLAAFNHFAHKINMEEIGYFGTAYNISSHKDVLPNLTCQIASHAKLKLDTAPMEYPYYGCAGGFLPLREAINYCKQSQKAAVVFIFDQCTYRAVFNYDQHDSLFMSDIKTNLLFSDGAVALLLIPENLRSLFPKVLKITDFMFKFLLGNEIGFINNHFVIGDIKSFMPKLVSDHIIKPILKRNNLKINDIDEWSIHQGGTLVLNRFAEPDILGLSQEQLEPSLTMFKEYGNLSAPSAFLVLHNMLQQNNVIANSNDKGCVVAFGAGYYLGSFLYERIYH